MCAGALVGILIMLIISIVLIAIGWCVAGVCGAIVGTCIAGILWVIVLGYRPH